MEFYSYDDNADPSTQKYVHGQADTLGGELWDIKFGPAVWRQILRMIGNDNQEYMPFIYRHLLELPTNEFNQRMQQFLKGEPQGRQYIADLVAKIKAAHEGGGEPPLSLAEAAGRNRAEASPPGRKGRMRRTGGKRSLKLLLSSGTYWGSSVSFLHCGHP